MHLTADVLGWFPTNSGMNVLSSAPVLDTQAGIGTTAGPIAAGADRIVTVAGHIGIPAAGGGTLVANVRTSGVTSPTDITVWPTGDAVPAAPTLTAAPGVAERNLAFVPVAADGTITVRTSAGNAHVTIDAVGWLPATAGYNPVVPTAVLDTTTGLGAVAGQLKKGKTVSPVVAGLGGVPSTGATAVVLNVRASNSNALTDLTVWTTGTTRPAATHLRVRPRNSNRTSWWYPWMRWGDSPCSIATASLTSVPTSSGIRTPDDRHLAFVPDTLTLTAANQTQTAQLVKYADDGSIISNPTTGRRHEHHDRQRVSRDNREPVRRQRQRDVHVDDRQCRRDVSGPGPGCSGSPVDHERPRRTRRGGGTCR